jgi:hypothetical protein
MHGPPLCDATKHTWADVTCDAGTGYHSGLWGLQLDRSMINACSLPVPLVQSSKRCYLLVLLVCPCSRAYKHR